MNIIFDFDGTIADSKQCSILATQSAFKELDLDIPTVEAIEYYMGIPIEQSFLNMASAKIDEKRFQQLLYSFRNYNKAYESTCLKLFPDMKETLKELVGRGHSCFIVTSKKTEVLKRNLDLLKIDSYFLDIVGSDKVSHYKPHPDGINRIVETYGLNKNECIMIGDAIFDIQMGKAAGCSTCGVLWGSHSKDMMSKEEPEHIIDSVKELLHIVE